MPRADLQLAIQRFSGLAALLGQPSLRNASSESRIVSYGRSVRRGRKPKVRASAAPRAGCAMYRFDERFAVSRQAHCLPPRNRIVYPCFRPVDLTGPPVWVLLSGHFLSVVRRIRKSSCFSLERLYHGNTRFPQENFRATVGSTGFRKLRYKPCSKWNGRVAPRSL